ncbi:hypothetical protein [Paenibacillus guangzhouensis]|uniref:hypothetical protein n=1 Tax=Paenibacillus guangzhouensis TaxID=1473112 RepID=UPI0012670107|nr:hypothetical protein [Paenibacillus guangzhouensis]
MEQELTKVTMKDIAGCRSSVPCSSICWIVLMRTQIRTDSSACSILCSATGRAPFAEWLEEGQRDGSIRQDLQVEVCTAMISNVMNATIQRIAIRGDILH